MSAQHRNICGRCSNPIGLCECHIQGRINHDIDSGVIMAGDRIIATMAYEPGNDGWRVSCSDARRLVACWNACEGAPTEWLEQNKPVKELADAIRDAQAQRDELLMALKAISENCYDPRLVGSIADEAIAKAEKRLA